MEDNAGYVVVWDRRGRAESEGVRRHGVASTLGLQTKKKEGDAL